MVVSVETLLENYGEALGKVVLGSVIFVLLFLCVWLQYHFDALQYKLRYRA